MLLLKIAANKNVIGKNLIIKDYLIEHNNHYGRLFNKVYRPIFWMENSLHIRHEDSIHHPHWIHHLPHEIQKAL